MADPDPVAPAGVWLHHPSIGGPITSARCVPRLRACDRIGGVRAAAGKLSDRGAMRRPSGRHAACLQRGEGAPFQDNERVPSRTSIRHGRFAHGLSPPDCRPALRRTRLTTPVRAITHFVPDPFPLLPPREGAATAGADLLGEIGLLALFQPGFLEWVSGLAAGCKCRFYATATLSNGSRSIRFSTTHSSPIADRALGAIQSGIGRSAQPTRPC